jgi:outer membrane protein
LRKVILILVLITIVGQLNAQDNILEDYIQEGLESNLVIKQNLLALENARQALKIAKGMFLPTVSTQSRYTLAQGGRTIDFPIGDLLNPVYSTLNDMLEAQGGSAQFPMVENQQINFLRNQEYEAKVSVTQAIYYPSIAINKKIEEQRLFMSETELEQYRRELRYQIKEAYYNYMKAWQFYDLILKTKEVVNENHRVSEKLKENDMITLDAVLRTKSEISKVELYETEAIKNKEMAKSYFNFLLNKDLDEEVILCSQAEMFVNPEINGLTENALNQRQELQLLDNQNNGLCC